MSWKVRHQGSPQSVERLSLTQVVEGLQDGIWDSTAEVLGPRETRWTSMERHPLLEDVVQDFEANQDPLREVDDAEEQRIDMNPLIDVCLVLLVFFVLATTMQVLEKVINVPGSKSSGSTRVFAALPDYMIPLTVQRQADRTIIKVDGQVVRETDLQDRLAAIVREGSRRELLIDAQGVEWGTVVRVIDAAGGARVRKVHFNTTRRAALP